MPNRPRAFCDCSRPATHASKNGSERICGRCFALEELHKGTLYNHKAPQRDVTPKRTRKSQAKRRAY
jgi:hypothetical protein